MIMASEVATLGGGCFWCLEAVYQQLKGVTAVESGYAGGRVVNPSYEAVCEGTTGHAEVVQVTFDTDVVTFREVLEVFFTIHDPTTLNRQGNDVGTQYRSVVFTNSEAQRATAQAVIERFSRDGLYDGPIVTEVTPLDGNYWPAEDYHRNYYANHPTQGYCAFVVAPKVAKFRQKFAHRFQA